jgi:glycosyltransferase involved in cell wall biosynthesis
LASLFFATLARRRPVWSFRQTLGELAQESVNTRFVILMLSLLRWASTRIVYNSAAAEASHCARWFDSARSLIVHNGIDLDEFTPAVRRMRSGPVVFGMLARMHPMKGHAFFVDALSSIASPARVMFVGRGCDPQAAPIKAFARVLADRAPNVELVACGESEKVAESLGEIDFLVLPSLRGESFPNVVLEGMACGAIPIVSRVGMSAEIVAGNGLVFEAGSRDGLLDCLERATRMSDDERSQLRTHALGRAREFGVDKMAAAFQRALEMEG